MSALREVFARFGIEFDPQRKLVKGARDVEKVEHDLKKVDHQAKETKHSLMDFARQVAAAFGAMQAIRWGVHFVDQATQAGDALDKLSQQLGLTAQQLQQYQLAAELGGVNSRSFSRSLRQLQMQALQADQGGRQFIDRFRRLGVEIHNADGTLKAGSVLFQDVARAISSIQNPTERVGQASLLLGESGAKLIPMLRDVGAGGDRLRRQLDALGGGFSDLSIRRSAQVRDEMARLKVSFDSVRSVILERFGPAILSFLEHGTRVITKISRIVSRSHVLEATLITVSVILLGIAGALAVINIEVVGPFAVLIAMAAASILVLDELWTTFDGGDSVIRRFLDHFLGHDEMTVYLQTIRNNWQEIISDVESVFEWMLRLYPLTSGFVDLLQAASDASRFLADHLGSLLGVDFGHADVAQVTRAMSHAFATNAGSGHVASSVIGAGVDNLAAQAVGGLPGSHTDVHVDSPVNVNISGVTDPQSVGRIVEQRLREHSDRQARQLQAALVPEGSS